MSLRIRRLKLVVVTDKGDFGADIKFPDGLGRVPSLAAVRERVTLEEQIERFSVRSGGRTWSR